MQIALVFRFDLSSLTTLGVFLRSSPQLGKLVNSTGTGVGIDVRISEVILIRTALTFSAAACYSRQMSHFQYSSISNSKPSQEDRKCLCLGFKWL